MRTRIDAQTEWKEKLREANSCIAVGAGLGAWGVGSALLVGATCPLCVVVAPALIGVGVWKRIAAGRRNDAASKSENAADEVDQRQAMQQLSGK